MHVIHKKVAFLLLGLAVLAFIVIILVYDQLPQEVRNFIPSPSRNATIQELESQTDEQLLDSITEDFSILDSEYDFNSDLDVEGVDVPNLESDLELTDE